MVASVNSVKKHFIIPNESPEYKMSSAEVTVEYFLRNKFWKK